MPALQKKVVRTVAEGQHSEAQVFESLCLTADRFPEQGGVVGELTVAERGCDDHEVGGRLKVADVDLVEFDGLRFDPSGAEQLGEGHRRVLGVAHIGAISNDQ